MTINEVRKRYLKFMESNGHYIAKSSPLVPENDPTTLFTAAGMQPMINYILGDKHPMGSRIADTQKCFRSQDIDEVGDNRHTTFFEMLGNWSFGDYFKKEQIAWMYKFLLDKEIGLGLDKDRLYFSCYRGNEKLNINKDEESKNFWIENGIDENHIYFYDEKKNWWSRAGSPENMPIGEPGGPDSEMFFDFDPKGEKMIHENSIYKNDKCNPNCDCGRFLEIGNSVFIQYKRVPPTPEVGVIQVNLKALSQQNVDFGGGLTRMAAATDDDADIFNLDIFQDAKSILENISGKKYNLSPALSEGKGEVLPLGEDLGGVEFQKNFRIILDHIHAATFLIGDGVMPGNKDQMYFVRRLVRRAIVAAHKLGIQNNFTKKISESFIEKYKEAEEYLGDNLSKNKNKILEEIDKEETKFRKTLVNGIKKFEKITRIAIGTYIPYQDMRENFVPSLSPEIVFELITTDGFPEEVIKEISNDRNIVIDWEEVKKLITRHKDLSRTASEGMFKGGLADQGEITTALHTVCHLMLAGMRKVLGENITQAGSNITTERLRFDFTFDRKVEDEEIKEIENYVNNAIQNGFEVKIEEMNKTVAKESGVAGAFWDKYPEIVKVYTVLSPALSKGKGEMQEMIYSKELCGGPHVENSEDYLKGKTFSIIKQEAVSAGVRRFKGVLR